MTQQHEVNKRIMDEIKNYKTDECTKKFLLEVLYFELEHFDERAIKDRIRFRETYERLIKQTCADLGE